MRKSIITILCMSFEYMICMYLIVLRQYCVFIVLYLYVS